MSRDLSGPCTQRPPCVGGCPALSRAHVEQPPTCRTRPALAPQPSTAGPGVLCSQPCTVTGWPRGTAWLNRPLAHTLGPSAHARHLGRPARRLSLCSHPDRLRAAAALSRSTKAAEGPLKTGLVLQGGNACVGVRAPCTACFIPHKLISVFTPAGGGLAAGGAWHQVSPETAR